MYILSVSFLLKSTHSINHLKCYRQIILECLKWGRFSFYIYFSDSIAKQEMLSYSVYRALRNSIKKFPLVRQLRGGVSYSIVHPQDLSPLRPVPDYIKKPPYISSGNFESGEYIRFLYHINKNMQWTPQNSALHTEKIGV